MNKRKATAKALRKKNYSLQGKKNREAGQRFEVKVRKDFESSGWIVDRWSKNVQFSIDYDTNEFPFERAKLIPARTNKFNMRTTGFPDFIVFKKAHDCQNGVWYLIMGIECKLNGYLDKVEKAKCKWLLDNNIFSKILIAKKGKKRGEIVYDKFIWGER